MDKGVINNHKGQITCTPRPTDEGKSFPDVVLRPGKNRLTQEQFAAIMTNKTVRRYFDIGLLRQVKIEEGTEDSVRRAKGTGDPDEVDGLPDLDKMKKADLQSFAKKRFKLELEGTNDEIKTQILEAAEQKAD